MPVYAEASKKTAQAIIQWHKTGEERPQPNFESARHIIHLTEADIEQSKSDHFNEEWPSASASYKLKPARQKIHTAPTDIFLYGHSTFRDYRAPKPRGDGKLKEQVRGISINHSYVSAGKVADYLDGVCPSAKRVANPIRVWLMSCHSASDDLCDAGEVYARSFTEKLSNKGWKNARVIGFETEVNYFKVLPKVRALAESTKLYSPLDFPKSLQRCKPHIMAIDKEGNVSSKK